MDYELLWIKAVHFVSTAMSSAWGRYQVIYLIHIQQTPTGVGLLRAAGLLAKFVATPWWGAYSDEKFDSTFPLVLSALACMFLLEFYRSRAVVGSFWTLLVLKCVRSAANGQGTLVDVLTLRVIEKHEGAGYGEQRVWTGVAWGVSCFVVGCLIDRFGWGVLFLWTYGFTLALLVLLFTRPNSAADGGGHASMSSSSLKGGGNIGDDGASAMLLDEHGNVASNGEHHPAAAAASSSEDFMLAPQKEGGTSPLALKQPQHPRGKRPSTATENLADYWRALPAISGMSSFLLIMVIYGMAMSLVESLMYLQMARDFGATKSLMGMVTLAGTVTEYPCFHYSKRLLRRHGPCSLLRVAHVVMLVRLVLLSLVTPATHVVLPLLQVLHGPCFALAWAAAVDWSAQASPHALKSTSQAVLSAAYYVVGAGVGSVLWSSLYEAFGARLAYLLGAASVAASLSLLLANLKRPGHDDDVPSFCRKTKDVYFPQNQDTMTDNPTATHRDTAATASSHGATTSPGGVAYSAV